MGYRSNDAYSSYIAMGRPSQLNRQQVQQIKKTNDGAPEFTENVTVKNGTVFSKALEIRENDVYYINLIRL